MTRPFNLEHSIARRNLAEAQGAEAIAIMWLRKHKPDAETAAKVTPHLQALRRNTKAAHVIACMAELPADALRIERRAA